MSQPHTKRRAGRAPGGYNPSRLRGLLSKPAPTWSVCYALGVEMNKGMDTECTLEELAAALGVTKQNAYTESVLALGKLTWHLARRVGPV